MSEYVAHLADDANPLVTACGESWQGWQAPEGIDPHLVVLGPHETPARDDCVRLCGACRRAMVRAT